MIGIDFVDYQSLPKQNGELPIPSEIQIGESLQQNSDRTEESAEASIKPKEEHPQITVCVDTADHVGAVAMPLINDSPRDVATNESEVESSNISDGPVVNQVELTTNEDLSCVSIFTVVTYSFKYNNFLWYVVRIKGPACPQCVLGFFLFFFN